MLSRDVVRFVAGTTDPAFAVDGLGDIVAWNVSAVDILGISLVEAIGKPCSDVICGIDDDGMRCSEECIIRQPSNAERLLQNFDLRIVTPTGDRWFNVSLIVLDSGAADRPYTIHILRSVDINKRLELLLRDFVIRRTNISRAKAVALVSSTKSLARETTLTARETEILKMVARSKTSLDIADKLQISPVTVDNHLQRILKKLGAHSRLEAVLRAEHSGLL
jgi:DNA-binding CsgD family transcriptional regulator